MATGTRALVPASPRAPSPVGLLTSVPRIRGNGAGESNWQRGLTFGPDGYTPARAEGFDCGPGVIGAPDVNPAAVVYDPILLYSEEACTAFQAQARDRDLRERVRSHLDVATQLAVEHEFWHGAAGVAAGYPNRALASASAVDVTPGTVPTPAQGLAILEQVLAEGADGARGMIHLPRAIIQPMGPRRDGRLFLSQVDTILVPGSGYSGSAPTTGKQGTTTATQTWLYATDVVDVWLDDITVVPEDIDTGAVTTSVNTVTYTAQRVMAVTFDLARHFAVKVDAGFPIRGTATAPTP